MAAPASAATWQGFYIGVQAGDTWGEVSHPFGDIGGPLDGAERDIKVNSLNGGAHAGFDFPIGQFVIGALADYNFVDLEGDDGASGGVRNGIKIDSIITARARGGWRFSPGSLIYATVGGAWLEGKATEPGDSVDADNSGYTYGLGAEFVVGEDATIGFEWRRFELDQERVTFVTGDYDAGIEPELDTFQIHLNYYLGGLMD